jgi:hypothetical protein
MRNRVRWARFHAIPAENTPRIINVVHAGVTFTRRNPIHIRILSRFDVNAVRRASRGTQKASNALLQAIFIAVQHVNPAITRLKMHLLVRIIFRNCFSEYVAKCDAEALR